MKKAFLCLLGLLLSLSASAQKSATYWNVEDIRIGMKGYGKTVVRGTTIERFDAEVLSVQKDVSPGRDLILVKLSGCNLEHTGIVAGMSGSPIYIDKKLVGAVAFAWPFGKDPIAGVTPFSQMVQFAGNLRSGYLADLPQVQKQPPSSGRSVVPNLKIIHEPFQAFWNRAHRTDRHQPLGMKPISMPLVASGFSERSIGRMSSFAQQFSMMPVMAGDLSNAAIPDADRNRPIEPGSPLSIALVTGDFDLSAVGTVTHVEGDRVYGFGHPMFSLGKCEFPLMSGYIHVTYPSQDISFKMSSPVRSLGTIDADVSTCVAGQLGTVPDMVPMKISVQRPGLVRPHTYEVAVVREPSLLPSLVFNVLNAAIDTEGNLPDQLTMELKAEIKPKGQPAISFSDIYSGPQFGGKSAPPRIYSILPNIVNALVNNSFGAMEIESIQCSSTITETRRSARIGKVFINSSLFRPGETIKTKVELIPFQGPAEHVVASITLPKNLKEGRYRFIVCDSSTSLGADLRNQPHLLAPTNSQQMLRVLRLQVAQRNDQIYLRVQSPTRGIAINGDALPDLPASVATILNSNRTTGTSPIRTEHVAMTKTQFAIQGMQALTITVKKNKRELN